MKSFIRTIMVLGVFGLFTGSFALAQDPLQDTLQTEAPVAEEAPVEAVAETTEPAVSTQRSVPLLGSVPLLEAPESKTKELLSLLTALTKTPRHGGKVLVIPTQQIKAENLVMIMEDMSVMSCIFDKKFSKGSRLIRGVFSDYGDFFGRDSRATEAIYLQGYGALFLMEANFPLTPPPRSKEKEAKKTEEPADPIWQQTKQEIFDPMIRTTRRISQPGEKYDAEQIEEVKKELVKSLKHAANIRNLKPDEWVILTVTGAGRQPNEVFEYGRLIRPDDATGSAYPGGAFPGGYGSGGYGGSYRERGSPSAMVLTIRAKKSDVDAFAKGELDFDKFRQKVQILTYPSFGSKSVRPTSSRIMR